MPQLNHKSRRNGWPSVRSLWLGALAILAFSLAGCRTEHRSAVSNTLIYGHGQEAQSLDPIHRETGDSAKLMANLFDTLVTYDDETLDLVPGLATRWTQSDDGLTWTFQLRAGVTFHDGERFDAESVVFSFQRLLRRDPVQNPRTHELSTGFQVIEDVVASGPLEVQFQLKEPSTVFFHQLASIPASIVSPAATKKHGNAFSDNPVGTGPFQFVRWVRGRQIVLEANPDHWQGSPSLQRVVFVPVADGTSRVQQLRQGKLHIADNLTARELDALADTAGVVVQQHGAVRIAQQDFVKGHDLHPSSLVRLRTVRLEKLRNGRQVRRENTSNPDLVNLP